ncbi:MAG: hypothetical protein WDW36_002714 [Sanguina aurantia]
MPCSRLAATSSSPLPSTTLSRLDDPVSRSADRARRLTVLVELRRLFRNALRAQVMMEMSSPIYIPQAPPSSSTTGDAAESDAVDPAVLELEIQEQVKAAVAVVAEMQLVLEQLKASLRALPSGFGFVFGPGKEESSEEKVRTAVREYACQLKDRFELEIAALPFPSEAVAQAAVDARNARYSRRQQQSLDEQQQQQHGDEYVVTGSSSLGNSSIGSSGMWNSPSPTANAAAAAAAAGSSSYPTVTERLELAEKVAERFVASKIKPALRRASERDIVDLIKDSGSYLKGFWIRLNGGGVPNRRDRLVGLQLPLPVATKRESELGIGALSLELESLEKELQEASKVRENRLRKAGIAGRVQMAIQLKLLDAEVLGLSAVLAVRTLQLEMEHVYRSLEDEALDVVGSSTGDLIARDGSSAELALLVAEYELLDEQLTVLASGISTQEGGSGSRRSSSSGIEGALTLVNDGSLLEKLAMEVPDMCSRVGVGSQQVFGGSGFSLTKAQLQAEESKGKVLEAVNFLVRGVRLLGSDAQNSVRLVTKAALGNSLKPREVAAIRRTALDLVTFIPFTIILIIPLTPLGHVLIFGFIQRYFPQLFPSQFNTRRQVIMVRYEELQRQLLAAQATAEKAEDEADLARAAAAVARLTSPGGPELITALSSVDNNTKSVSSIDEAATLVMSSEAARKVRLLEEQLAEIREDVNSAAAASEDGDSSSQAQSAGGSAGTLSNRR